MPSSLLWALRPLNRQNLNHIHQNAVKKGNYEHRFLPLLCRKLGNASQAGQAHSLSLILQQIPSEKNFFFFQLNTRYSLCCRFERKTFRPPSPPNDVREGEGEGESLGEIAKGKTEEAEREALGCFLPCILRPLLSSSSSSCSRHALVCEV